MAQRNQADVLRLFSEQLRRQRRAAGLTQEELAERAGVSPYTISNLERGVQHLPRKDTVLLLADALGLTVEEHAAFLAAARPRERLTLPTPAGAAPLPKVPTLLTPLVGRTVALTMAASLLHPGGTRLLTLVGPPGVGKTSLALAVAAAQADRYPDGCAWVPLAAVQDPALVPESLVQALQLHQEERQSIMDLLAARLANKRLLLLLDNFEQVAAAAPAVAELLSACPMLTCLVTSRVPLRLRGEHLYRVDPLPVPQPEEPFATLPQVEAAALFLARAQAAQPDFHLTEENAAAVGAICRRLDGLPLALELAAPYLRLLPARELATRLAHALDVLSDGPADLPAHQRTLRETIAWSHALLSPSAQAVLRRLAVFAGGCRLEAAEALCADPNLSHPPWTSTFQDLAVLVDHQLIQRVGQQDEHGTGVRLQLLETIREYGLEELERSGERPRAERLHARYYLELAETAARELAGPERRRWATAMEHEQANLRAALTWASHQGLPEFGLRLAVALAPCWEQWGTLEEARRWLGALLSLPATHGSSAPPALRAEALTALGRAALWQGDLEDARAALEAARAIAEELDEAEGQPLLGAALNGLGILAKMQVHYEEALSLFMRTLTCRRATGDTVGIANALMNLGNVQRRLGDVTGAEASFEESTALYRQLGDQSNEATALGSLGNLARDLGQMERASALLEECLSMLRSAGEPRDFAITLFNLGDVRRMQREPAPAVALCQEGVELCLRGDLKSYLVLGLESWAAALAEGGAYESAVRLFGAAAALRERYSLPVEPGDQVSIDEVVARTRGALGEARVTQLWQEAFTAPEQFIQHLLGA